VKLAACEPWLRWRRDESTATPTLSAIERPRALDAESEWSTLVDAIDLLPDAERHTLLLYAWEDLSYEDIAAALEIPVGTVRSRLNRARRRLRTVHRDSEQSSEGTAR
jgi:RNA polymerase sigma factor (sigma-70 family)